MRALGTIGIIGLVGVVLGAVNWGLVGLFDYDLGAGTAADVVYIAIGVFGVLALGAVVWAFGVVTRGGAGSVLAVIGAIAVIVAVIGAINWGLVGLFDVDLVEEIFGTGTAADAVYTIVGIAGLLTIPTLLGAWGFRSGERRVEESETFELHRDLEERRRRDGELTQALEDSRRREEELAHALEEGRRRDEELTHALEEGRRRDEELAEAIDEIRRLEQPLAGTADAAHGSDLGYDSGLSREGARRDVAYEETFGAEETREGDLGAERAGATEGEPHTPRSDQDLDQRGREAA
jgi:uncharacterized protein